MKAMVVGADSQLKWSTVAEPQVGATDVLIDIRSSGINRADLAQRDGRYPPPAGAPEYLGLECAGIVVGVGADVTGVAVGDTVCALLPGGGYAQRVAVDYRLTLPIPRGISVNDAGGLVETACTVWSNLVGMGGMLAQDTLLVHGGASGIGCMAIQVAKTMDVTVLTTARGAEKGALCTRLGADLVIDYEKEDFVAVVAESTGGRGVDLILDVQGGDYLARNVNALARKGRLLVIGLQGGREGNFPIGTLLNKAAMVSGASMRNRPLHERAEIVAGVRRDVWPLIESGAIVPVVDSTYDIDDVEAAHTHMRSGSHVGKILLVQAG